MHNNVTDDVHDHCGDHVVEFELTDACDVDDGANALGDYGVNERGDVNDDDGGDDVDSLNVDHHDGDNVERWCWWSHR